MSDGPILLDFDGPLAVLRLNRPAVLNAFDVPMAQAFGDAVAEIGASKARAILLQGEGRAFCAGGDVGTFLAGPRPPAAILEELIGHFHTAVERLMALGLPTVAAVQGMAAGAGFSLAVACDHLLAAEGARFSLAYTRLGATADGGITWTLPRLIGMRAAKRIALMGDVVDAHDAERLGLVDRIVPAEALEREARAAAMRLANGPTHAFAAIKTLLDHSFGTSFQAQLRAEKDAFVAVTATADFREGVAAFTAKRPPSFEGR